MFLLYSSVYSMSDLPPELLIPVVIIIVVIMDLTVVFIFYLPQDKALILKMKYLSQFLKLFSINEHLVCQA